MCAQQILRSAIASALSGQSSKGTLWVTKDPKLTAKTLICVFARYTCNFANKYPNYTFCEIIRIKPFLTHYSAAFKHALQQYIYFNVIVTRVHCYSISEKEKYYRLDCIICFAISFYTTSHDSSWILWFHVGRPSSVYPPFRFRTIMWVNTCMNAFSSNLLCVPILWRSGLGLLMAKFGRILTVISPRHVRIFVSRR